MEFLTGHELTWMPEALRILRDELPNIDLMISTQYSPLLKEGLSKGKIDAAFLRKERALPDVAFRSCLVTTGSPRSRPSVRGI
jgi:LysR family hca operon transcriptional activator